MPTVNQPAGIPPGWDRVAHDGELILYASPNREEGVVYDESTGKVSDPKNIQVFFKWGNFVEAEG